MTSRLLAALAPILLLWPLGTSPCSAQQAPSRAPVAADETRAQETSRSRTSARPSRTRIGVWGAGSVYPGGVLGTLQNGWLGLVGLRYHRLLIPGPRARIAAHDAATLTYTADLVPLARVTVPDGTPPAARSLGIRSVTEAGLDTWGVGVYPLGLRVGFRPARSLRPFVAGHTGLFHLFDAMPDERGRRLNFAVGVGAGVEISLPRHTILTLGYRYHHLSNGFRGRINPGLDANLLYVGVGVAP